MSRRPLTPEQAEALRAYKRDWARRDRECRPERQRAACRRYDGRHPERRVKTRRNNYLKNIERRREDARERVRQQWIADSEKMRERGRLRRQTKPELIREQARQRYQRPQVRAYAIWAAGCRRAAELRATPAWLTAGDHERIRAFYGESSRRTLETGLKHHVDHIIPLRGKLVSGLHVPTNLQVLIGEENQKKNNKFFAEASNFLIASLYNGSDTDQTAKAA